MILMQQAKAGSKESLIPGQGIIKINENEEI